MKTEIKFRGINKENGNWVYGSFVESKRKGHWFMIQDEYSNETYYVHAESVSQYINLKAKDNVEIYVGSILQEEAPRSNKHRVFSVHGGFAINTHQDDLNRDTSFYDSTGDRQTASYLSNCVVIGNVYENPELLIKN